MSYPLLDSVDDRAMAAIANLINLMQLPGILGVYEQQLPDSRAINLPGILITKEGQAEEELDTSDLVSEDFSLPYNLFLVDRQPPSDSTSLPVYQGWRQAIAHNFRSRTWLGDAIGTNVPECWDILPKLMQTIDPAYFRQAEGFWMVSGMTLTAKVTLTRQTETAIPYVAPITPTISSS